MKKIMGALGFAVVLLLAGCSSSTGGASGLSAAERQQMLNEAAAPSLPDGFTDAGTGAAVKWLDKDDPRWDCGYLDSCVNVEVYAYEPCLRGVYIEANILNGDTVVDWTNGTLSALDAGQTGIIKLGKVGTTGGSTYKMTQVSCS